MLAFIPLMLGLLAGAASAEPGPTASGDAPWLTYPGGKGPGEGKRIVLISADQEYRTEHAMPMLARILSEHHGFDCTVLFGVNDEGLVDPTLPVYPKRGEEDSFREHNIPGLEALETADALVFATRLLTLPEEQLRQFVNYFDSGKPIIALRTANHGFRSPLPYEMNGKRVTIGEILGGRFLNHHGVWQQDSTRGDIVPAMKDHPILVGVSDIWGLSDVYRTFPEGEDLPEGCTALVYGQPLIGRKSGGEDNPDKEPLPVVWIKQWQTSDGESARVLHSTMGSASDLKNPGLRRLIINAVYWGLGMEEQIDPQRSVDFTRDYQPPSSGFDYEDLGVEPRPVSSFK